MPGRAPLEHGARHDLARALMPGAILALREKKTPPRGAEALDPPIVPIGVRGGLRIRPDRLIRSGPGVGGEHRRDAAGHSDNPIARR